MSSVENFDGRCGIIATFADSSRQIRCHYIFDHGGPCSFIKYREQFGLHSSCARNPKEVKEEQFIDSVIWSMQQNKNGL
jgi:hypothetical protein